MSMPILVGTLVLEDVLALCKDILRQGLKRVAVLRRLGGDLQTPAIKVVHEARALVCPDQGQL